MVRDESEMIWKNQLGLINVSSRHLLGATEKDCEETQFRILGIATEVRTNLHRYRCTILLSSGISETAYPLTRCQFYVLEEGCQTGGLPAFCCPVNNFDVIVECSLTPCPLLILISSIKMSFLYSSSCPERFGVRR